MKENCITIDVVSDVACPWCYVGKRRLEDALNKWDGAPIKVNWHPYQLDPSMQQQGMNRDTYLTNKFGSIENVQEMTDRLTEVGKSVGIDFDFGDNWLAVNTLPLHQLLHVANNEGFGIELKEKFLEGYFEKSLHLNNRETLYIILEEFGWTSEKVDSIIDSQEIAQKVKQEIQHYQQRGVSGVPFFVINDKYGISGAQPPEAFLEAFASVSKEINGQGESCDHDSGCC